LASALQLVFVTCPAAAAEALAHGLVESRVAACVNIVDGLRSVYRWQGAVQQEQESLLLIKIPADGFERLRTAVIKAHPYELPEIVAVQADAVHAPYLDWVIASCR
jgi:periplasmic divalent cation tolerance protein